MRVGGASFYNQMGHLSCLKPSQGPQLQFEDQSSKLVLIWLGGYKQQPGNVKITLGEVSYFCNNRYFFFHCK